MKGSTHQILSRLQVGAQRLGPYPNTTLRCQDLTVFSLYNEAGQGLGSQQNPALQSEHITDHEHKLREEINKKITEDLSALTREGQKKHEERQLMAEMMADIKRDQEIREVMYDHFIFRLRNKFMKKL